MNNSELGGLLKDRRVSRGYTQADMAIMTGIRRPNISRIESGRHSPTLETLLRVCDVLGLDVCIGPVRL